MIKVFENCIPIELQNRYLDFANKLDWIYNNSTIYNQEVKESRITDEIYDVGQLSRPLYPKEYHSFDPLIKLFDQLYVLRIKYNLLWRCADTLGRWNSPHRDMEENEYVSGIYYVKDSDGDTVFFGDTITRITPKKGTLVIFPSNLLHASSNPQISQERIVINFVARQKDINISAKG